MSDYIVKMRTGDGDDVQLYSADIINTGYQTKNMDEALISQSPLDIRRYYAYSGGGSDWGAAINQAFADGHTYIGIPTGEVFSCASSIVLPEPSSTTARSDVYICGIGGMGRLGSSGPHELIRSYDVSTITPTKWTRGVVLRDLELDGSDKGTHGIRLHHCAQNVTIQNCYVHNFTTSQLYLAGCLETLVSNTYCLGNQTDQPSYGIYLTDGTTQVYTNVTVRLCQTGLILAGDMLGESGNNDGPDDIVWNGGVIEACKTVGIHVSAGDRVRFRDVHIEDIGYGASSLDTSYGVKVSNEGGATPRNTLFDHCTIAVNTDQAVVNHKAFYLAHGNRTEFRRCQDGSTRGGTIDASASYTLIESGTYQNDFRIASGTGNITDNGSETTFLEWDQSGFHIARGASDYFRVSENPYVQLVRAASTNDVLVCKEAASSTSRFVLSASGAMGWADTDGAADTTLTRSEANYLQTGSGDKLHAQGGIITKEGTSGVSDPPTAVQIANIFGTPTDGYIGIINDDALDTDVWLCVKSNGSWFYTQLTLAV